MWLLWLLLSPVQASDARYALVGELQVPASSMNTARAPVRIELGPEWVARCPDPTTYLLQDAQGNEVPYAVRTSDDAPPGPERLTWEPIERSPWSWTYLVHGPESRAPTVALTVHGLPRSRVVEATVRRDSQIVTRTLLWNLPETGAGIRDTLPLPPGYRQGPWRVDLHVVNVWRARPWAEFSAWTTQIDQVEPVTWETEVDPALVIGPDQSRLVVPLPRGGLPVRGVRVLARDPLFSRPAVVRDRQGQLLGQGQLERFLYGVAPVDVDRLPVHALVSRTFTVDLTDDRSLPLEVDRVAVELRGLVLLARGGEPGRWLVSGCGPAGARYDVERLSSALQAHAPTPRLQPAPPRPNPEWMASLVTEGLAGPGQALRGRSAPWGRVQGEIAPDTEGALVRARLPPALLAVIRTDLADLRFVDEAGRQLPYLSEDVGGVPVPDVDWTEQQQGPVTILRLTLPHSGLPVEQLVLYAERARFRRPVTVDAGGAIVRTTWEGASDEASRLIVPLRGRASRQIEVRIDNGDNAPLPLLAPSLSMASTAVWMVLPPEGAEIRLLGSGAAPPRYDLAMLRSEILDGPALEAQILVEPPATPAPVRSLAPAPSEPSKAQLSWWVTPLVAAFALILGGLAFRLSRALPKEEGADGAHGASDG